LRFCRRLLDKRSCSGTASQWLQGVLHLRHLHSDSYPAVVIAERDCLLVGLLPTQVVQHMPLHKPLFVAPSVTAQSWTSQQKLQMRSESSHMLLSFL
jgi:hypothetical protein